MACLRLIYKLALDVARLLLTFDLLHLIWYASYIEL